MYKTPFKIPAFSNYTDENGVEVDGPPVNDTGITGTPTAGTGGRFWDIFNNVINGVNVFGDSVGNLRAKLDGTATASQAAAIAAQEQAKAAQSKQLMYVAGGVLAVIVVILLFKNKA